MSEELIAGDARIITHDIHVPLVISFIYQMILDLASAESRTAIMEHNLKFSKSRESDRNSKLVEIVLLKTDKELEQDQLDIDTIKKGSKLPRSVKAILHVRFASFKRVLKQSRSATSNADADKCKENKALADRTRAVSTQ